MNLFLQELSKAKEFEHNKIVMIMDGAGWHKSKDLIIPTNITIIYLPAYSPELNPIERLWLYIKKATLRNKVYQSLEDLEQVVSDFINSITNHTFTQVCSADYLYN